MREGVFKTKQNKQNKNKVAEHKQTWLIRIYGLLFMWASVGQLLCVWWGGAFDGILARDISAEREIIRFK